jgi:predicted PurR-regulated permease PerM
MNDSQKWLVLTGLAGFGWLVYLLSPVLTPFVAGALLAYLTDPFADRLEALGMKRTPAVALVFTAITLFAALALLLIVPLLEHQIDRVVDNLPAFASWLKGKALPYLRERYGLRIQLNSLEQLSALLGKHWQEAGGIAAEALGSLSHSSRIVLSWLINVLLIPVVTFYLLRDWDILVEKINDLLPRKLAPTVARLAREVDEVLSAFVRGQVTVMLCLTAIYSLGLWLIDLDLALLIGLFAGLVSFIPYMGATVGISSAGIAAIAQNGDVWAIVPVLIVFGVGQMLEGTVLTPKLVGGRIGLHPVAVIFSVLAGGQLFGFLGVLLAIPTAAAVMVLLRHAHDVYRGSRLYGEHDIAALSNGGDEEAGD